MKRIGIIGDYSPDYPSQKATNEALNYAISGRRVPVEYEWVATATIEERMDDIIHAYSGYWIAPGVPDDVHGVLRIVQYAREYKVPIIGTCGGFQNMLIEFARNKLMIEDAEHEERSPDGSKLFISKLACSLVGQQGEVFIHEGSKAHLLYQNKSTVEPFRCSYGLNPAYKAALERSGLQITGMDYEGQPRIIEIPDHPFYIGTLFVPQLNSAPDAPHCLVDAFVEQASR